MAQIISITSGKGGSGKSSVSVGLASTFARMGRRVIIVELDIGLRCVDIMLGLENDVVYDLSDIIAGNCSIQDGILRSEHLEGFQGVLDYIAAPTNISSEFDFDKVIECIQILKTQYDYVIVDTPAGLGLSILSVKNLSDLAIIVTTPDPICVRDGEKVAVLMEQVGFTEYRLIINKVSRRTMRKSPIKDLDAVIDGVGAQLIGVIPEDTEFQTALAKGEWLEAKNIASLVFEAIAARIEGKYKPLIIETI